MSRKNPPFGGLYLKTKLKLKSPIAFWVHIVLIHELLQFGQRKLFPKIQFVRQSFVQVHCYLV